MPKNPNNPKVTCKDDNDLQSPEEMKAELQELRGLYHNAEALRVLTVHVPVYDIKWYQDKPFTSETSDLIEAYENLEKTPGSLGM